MIKNCSACFEKSETDFCQQIILVKGARIMRGKEKTFCIEMMRKREKKSSVAAAPNQQQKQGTMLAQSSGCWIKQKAVFATDVLIFRFLSAKQQRCGLMQEKFNG